jgi:hypothetical protein
LRGGNVLPLRGVEEAHRLSNPASKSISRSALVLLGEGSHTNPLLGCSCLSLGGR